MADAIERGDLGGLKDELGDLLFQVVFHSQMASESGQFDFEAVAGAICDKLTRRHPHVFGDRAPLSVAEQASAWEEIKAEERGAADVSALQGVPNALPALLRAYKLSKRAARVGFDFEHAGQCADKVDEELAEVRARRRIARGVAERIAQGCAGDFRGSRRSAVCGRQSGAQARCRCRGGTARRQRKIRASLPRHGIAGGEARPSILQNWISPPKRTFGKPSSVTSER